jgi:biopolymer transport protein TolR
MGFDDLESGGSISQINVTPLVDVMLVLLVIFMVTSPILQQGVELELPQETIAPVEGEGEQLVVSIVQSGEVFIGKENRVEIDSIGERLTSIMSSRQDKRVFIRADRRVSYGQVMAVMGAIRRAGIVKVGLITEPS